MAREGGTELSEAAAESLRRLLEDRVTGRTVDSTRRGGGGLATFSPGLVDALDGLALTVAGDHTGPWDDEHDRWELYRDALDQGRIDPLRRLLEVEPDRHVAASVVLSVLEDAPDGDLDGWAHAVGPEARALVVTRVAEIRTERALEEGLPLGDAAAASWSDRLQRVLAASSARPDVLEALAVEGRTRRVRGRAQHRLGELRRRETADGRRRHGS